MSRTQARTADANAPGPGPAGRPDAAATARSQRRRSGGVGSFAIGRTAAGPEDEAREAVLPASLSDAVAYALRVAQESSFESFLRRVGNPDLKPGRYSALSVLAANPGLSPTALSRALGRDKSTVTATLRDLRAHGLIKRTDVPGDRRSYGVALTDEGFALLDRLCRHARQHDATLDAIVGADKPILMTILGRIVHDLTEVQPPTSVLAAGSRPEG